MTEQPQDRTAAATQAREEWPAAAMWQSRIRQAVAKDGENSTAHCQVVFAMLTAFRAYNGVDAMRPERVVYLFTQGE